MLGLHITDECLEQFFICFPTLLRMLLMGEGFSISLIGITFPWYLHIGTLVVSQSVKQCITVDLFLHILANVVDIQKVHLLLHTALLNKTPRLSSVIMFVRLYRLLLLHCIYVSVTKPTCPVLSAWLNAGAIRSMKVTGKAIILFSYGINIYVICSTTWPI